MFSTKHNIIYSGGMRPNKAPLNTRFIKRKLYGMNFGKQFKRFYCTERFRMWRRRKRVVVHALNGVWTVSLYGVMFNITVLRRILIYILLLLDEAPCIVFVENVLLLLFKPLPRFSAANGIRSRVRVTKKIQIVQKKIK